MTLLTSVVCFATRLGICQRLLWCMLGPLPHKWITWVLAWRLFGTLHPKWVADWHAGAELQSCFRIWILSSAPWFPTFWLIAATLICNKNREARLAWIFFQEGTGALTGFWTLVFGLWWFWYSNIKITQIWQNMTWIDHSFSGNILQLKFQHDSLQSSIIFQRPTFPGSSSTKTTREAGRSECSKVLVDPNEGGPGPWKLRFNLQKSTWTNKGLIKDDASTQSARHFNLFGLSCWLEHVKKIKRRMLYPSQEPRCSSRNTYLNWTFRMFVNIDIASSKSHHNLREYRIPPGNFI